MQAQGETHAGDSPREAAVFNARLGRPEEAGEGSRQSWSLRQPGPLRPPLSSNGDNLIPPEKPWDFTCFSGIF